MKIIAVSRIQSVSVGLNTTFFGEAYHNTSEKSMVSDEFYMNAL
jgi:hypothetical protein